MALDLQERIEVLQAKQKVLQSRLLAVSIPSEMLAYADHLENQAKELIAKANRVRENLARDTAEVQNLIAENEDVELEIMALRYCQQAKINATKAMIRKVVDLFRS